MTVEQYQIVINILVWAIVAGGGLFLTVVAWIGKQLHNQLIAISSGLKETNSTLGLIERDLRHDLSALDRRVIRLEVRNKVEPAADVP